MKKITAILTVLSLALFISSCSQKAKKDKAIKHFESFIEDVNTHQKTYSDQQWIESDTTFNQYYRKFDQLRNWKKLLI